PSSQPPTAREPPRPVRSEYAFRATARKQSSSCDVEVDPVMMESAVDRTKTTTIRSNLSTATALPKQEQDSRSRQPCVPQEKIGSRDQGSNTYSDDQALDKDEEKILKQFDFYHGFLPREDLYILVKYVGDYLLRVSEVDNEASQIRREIILSVAIDWENKKQRKSKNKRWPTPERKRKGQLKNVVVRRKNNKYLVETNRLFDNLQDLMSHYQKHYGVLKRFKFTLTNPIKQQAWEFHHSDVKQGNILGRGAFGEVRAGTLRLKTGKNVDVAIKVTRGSSDLCKAKIKEMMREARLMRNFRHENIVRIYGVAVDEQPLYIILELMTGGALNHFLKANAGKVSVMDKIAMCLGVARGAEYLHHKRCMHRDLAARNCLITRDKVVKISDFGLSRMGTSYVLHTSVRLPTKWLAPETITTLSFSLKTDVFSFGVVVYEIFSDGGEPWGGKTNAEVKALVSNGQFLTLPDCVPEAIRNFVQERVFVRDPAERASMTKVVEAFEQIQAADGFLPMAEWWWRLRKKDQKKKRGTILKSVVSPLTLRLPAR
ncbi:hypothetical protein V3C99_008463, partial [Haemonchus contortus]